MTKVLFTGCALTGWHKGEFVRKQFRTQAEAQTAKKRLEVEAANAEGAIRPVNTRLTAQQVATAETLFKRHDTPRVCFAQ